ncbi:hypothetical protein JD844_017318 [Phrynosoma platyrhinos]|uniref:PDZ domain-containing protein n=1 Tax=Phrynosoma platyrhinos TaxID=52577 RepID=A0ABQ7SLT8_PHRPL|nr:hypothetical protein JD844_017318 [Phrynosoma platyrhinos]
MKGPLPAGSGNMDGNFPTEKRKVLKSVKQCVKNLSRSKQPPERPEDLDNYCLNGPAWVPVGLSGDPSKGTSVLESKVKALKEKKSAINRQAEVPSQEWASPKKGKAWKGKSPTDPTSQNAVVEPQAQIRTYLTDVLLDSTDYYPQPRQEESLGLVPANSYVNDFDKLKGSETEEEPINIAWSSPEEFRRFPGRNILDKKGYLGKMTKRKSRYGLYGASSLKDLSCLQKSFEEVNGGEDHLVRARDLESCSSVHKNDGMVTTGRLWRTESWDSLGSGGSNATTLSLAERVEKNRSILQEMLSMSQLNSYSSHELHTLHRHKKENQVLGNDEPSNGILANDVDWDSGVSLQDSEGYRAFVPNQELELSPRHEQAKQLLQRARMKARTNPLRASHNILPTFSQERRDACGISAAEAKKFVLKDGDPHASGNLSDSSSGESSCGQQRKRGPSPSRVRFEDESARDAEVRYLERLQQRQKRVLDSVLLSLGRGPLVSKPDLSDYINGDLQRKKNGICKPGWEQQSTGQAGGALTRQSSRGHSEKGMPLVVNKEGKCSACGSYVSRLPTRNPDVSVNQTGNDMHKTCNVSQESKHLGLASEHKVLSASQEDTRTRPLGPKGTPLWILPSRQRVYTERIKETYIGEVTCIDDVDSALDSTTDTSDSYKTDSEEAGTSSQQSVFKTLWHGVSGQDFRPFCPSEKETRSMKNAGEKHWGNANYNTHKEEFQDNVPSINKMETGLSANEANNYNVKGASEIKSQVNKIGPDKAEAYTRGNQPVDLYPLAKKGKTQGHMKGPKAQFREPTVHSQQLPSYLAPDSLTNSVNKKSMESSSHRPTNNLNQVMYPSQQLNKQMAAGFNLGDQVPAPAATEKAHSPMPYRRAVLTSSHMLDGQDPGQVKEANELPVCSTSLHNIQHASVSQTEEHSGMQSPKILSKRQLLALSTNNCNNTHAKHQSKSSMISMVKSKEEQLQDSQKMRKKHGTPSSSTCGALPVNPSATGFIATSLSLSTEETNPTTCAQSISREAPVTEAQKTRSAQTSAIQRKPLEIYPEPKKKLYAKKGGSSSSSPSGLKKFFTTLSQNTKQKLGRFRCYSMEQIYAPEPGVSVPTEEPGPDITSSPKMKKAPSLQSLRMVSPFRQPRKASSVQNLQSLLGKTDRSSLYLLGEDEANPNRKAGPQQRRSLSVEDIGSPNLMRTVGRVVEVFPDGTSQLELQRSPQGNFGFRVSSGNGRPDTGIYIQEMADPNTAKLYAGLLGVGDEILEVNGAKVAGLGLAQINELLLWADTLSVRVLRQRPLRR